jgi:hypothetical protein
VVVPVMVLVNMVPVPVVVAIESTGVVVAFVL